MKKITQKLFVIEGGDGAGKGTQVGLLDNALREGGKSVTVFDFPQYETSIFGKLCGEALKGEHGDFRNMSPYIASLPYTLDRSTARDKIVEALRSGIVLCNRYTPSNVAFQSSKLSGKKKIAFIEFLEKAEYDTIGLPRPTLVIYLYVPSKIAAHLVSQKAVRTHLGKKKGVKDVYEKDLAFQRTVAKTYLALAKQRPDWVMINCAPKGKLLSREEIHMLIMREIETCLK